MINATEQRNEDMVRLLVNAGADPFNRDNCGRNAYFISTLSSRNTVSQLLEDCARIRDPSRIQEMKETTPYLECIRSIRKGRANEVQAILDGQEDLNTFLNPTHGGFSLLYMSCIWGRLDIAEILIRAGANVDLVNNYGFTPLMVASIYEHEDIVKLLMSKHADPTICDNSGQTAREKAERKKLSSMVILLADYEFNWKIETMIERWSVTFLSNIEDRLNARMEHIESVETLNDDLRSVLSENEILKGENERLRKLNFELVRMIQTLQAKAREDQDQDGKDGSVPVEEEEVDEEAVREDMKQTLRQLNGQLLSLPADDVLRVHTIYSRTQSNEIIPLFELLHMRNQLSDIAKRLEEA